MSKDKNPQCPFIQRLADDLKLKFEVNNIPLPIEHPTQ